MPDTTALLLSASTLAGFSSGDCLSLKVYPVKLTEDGEIRNFLASTYPREPLAELCILAQADRAYSNAHSASPAYGWRTEFHDVHSVNLARAKEMTNLLSGVERGLAKIQAELGYVESYGSYVARVAKVLRISKFGWKTDGEAFAYSGNRYHWTDATSFALRIERVILDFQKAGVS